jgi:hypothetical protein
LVFIAVDTPQGKTARRTSLTFRDPPREPRQPQKRTVREIAEMVIEISGSEFVHEPLPEDDPKRRCPGIRRARETLGWEPRVPVREGLRKAAPQSDEKNYCFRICCCAGDTDGSLRVSLVERTPRGDF